MFVDTFISCVVDKDAINLVSLENGSCVELRDTFDSKCCAYDSNGRNLVVGNSHGIIEIFDFKSQTQKRKAYKIQPESPSGGQVAVNWIGWSKNDRYIATGNSDGSIVLFNAVMTQMNKPLHFSAFRQAQTSPLKNISVTAMNYSIFNPGSLGAAYDEGSVALWDTNKESVSISYKSHNLPCTTISLSPVSAILMVSGGIDGLITLYDVNQKKPLKQIEASKNGIASIEFFKNGYLLCVGTLNGHIQVFDLRNDQQVYNSFKAHETSVNCIKILQNVSSQQMKVFSSLKCHSANFSMLENTLPCRPTSLNSNGNSLPSSAHIKHEHISPFSLQNQILKKSNSYSNSNLLNINNSNSTNSNVTGAYGKQFFLIFFDFLNNQTFLSYSFIHGE
jgi:WD40 repeat protein